MKIDFAMWRNIKFKSFLTIGWILIALSFLFMGGGCVINNLPVTPTQIFLTSTEPGTPTETATSAPTATSIPTNTATNLPPTASPTLQDGADLISFDTKVIGSGRKTFGFYGTSGQVVTIAVQFLQFPAHYATYALVLKNSNGEELSKNSINYNLLSPKFIWYDFIRERALNIKDFTLPNTSTYYINVQSRENWELNLTLVTP